MIMKNTLLLMKFLKHWTYGIECECKLHEKFPHYKQNTCTFDGDVGPVAWWMKLL